MPSSGKMSKYWKDRTVGTHQTFSAHAAGLLTRLPQWPLYWLIYSIAYSIMVFHGPMLSNWGTWVVLFSVGGGGGGRKQVCMIMFPELWHWSWIKNCSEQWVSQEWVFLFYEWYIITCVYCVWKHSQVRELEQLKAIPLNSVSQGKTW